MDSEQLAQQLKKPTGDQGIQVGEFMAKGNANFYKQLPGLLHHKAYATVLEIGMGAGFHIQELASQLSVNRYHAVDYSDLMVAQTILNNKGLSILKATHGNANNLSFADNYFDLLFTINTVYFYDSLETVFKEYNRVLKPCGILVIGKRTKENLIELSAFTQHGFAILSAETVVNHLEICGFKIVQQKTFDDPASEFKGGTVQLQSEFIIAKK